MKIGEIKNGMPVTISPSSPNEHILLVGTSGSGKSTRIAEMLADCVKRHETVIVIDSTEVIFVMMMDRKMLFQQSKTD